MNNYFVKELIYYRNHFRTSSFFLPEETIDYYDLTFVISGELTYKINGETYVLKKNDLLFLSPGTVRSREASASHVQYVSFNFTLLPNVSLNLPMLIRNYASPDIKKLFALFPTYKVSSYHYTKSKIIHLLNYICCDLLDFVALKSDNAHILKIIWYIDENITRKISSQTIANEIGLSLVYTCTIFKNEMGCTLSHYINLKKLSIAKELLANSELSLLEISNHLAYDNYHYFSRIFKKFFNISPQQYRENNKMAGFSLTP